MDKKSILAIEKIISYITELKIVTKGKDANYFFDGFEMPILCSLVDKIDKNINKINSKIKSKYNDVEWNIIDSKKDNDNGIKTLKLGKIWNLSSGLLENEMLNKLKKILENELPIYYMNYCNNQHKKALKERNGRKNELFKY